MEEKTLDQVWEDLKNGKKYTDKELVEIILRHHEAKQQDTNYTDN